MFILILPEEGCLGQLKHQVSVVLKFTFTLPCIGSFLKNLHFALEATD